MYEKMFNFATWWRYFSGRKVIENVYFDTKIAPPGAEIYFFFIEVSIHFPYHMQFLDIVILGVRCRSFEMTTKTATAFFQQNLK